jgi:hypothetical protein
MPDSAKQLYSAAITVLTRIHGPASPQVKMQQLRAIPAAAPPAVTAGAAGKGESP